MQNWQQHGFGLYLHWPFCESKCPYCDFNSHVAANIDQKHWQASYLAEIERLGHELPNRVLDTVFFGGGTPSLMDPELVCAIIDKVRATWPMRNDPEITLEANPGSIEAGRFRAYRQAGVSRISMGMQAMNDADLQRLGRRHTAEEARKAFQIARDCFDRVSFDLIYARQDQNLNDWRKELAQALGLAVDHLSLYQLTVEDGTAFADRFARGGLKGLPTEDLAADMYEVTQEVCDKYGLPAYEVSNHAKPGSESRHNLIYWRGGDYIGIGPGAHGRITINEIRWATEAPKSPGAWLSQTESGQPGEGARQALSAEEHGLENLLMGLRLSEGLDLRRQAEISGRDLDPTAVQDLIDLGAVALTPDRIFVTASGKLLLNAVIRKLAGA